MTVEVAVDRMRAVIQELSSYCLVPSASYQSNRFCRFCRPDWNEHDATVTALYGKGEKETARGKREYVYTG